MAVSRRLLANGVVIDLLVRFDEELLSTFTDYSYEVSLVV